MSIAALGASVAHAQPHRMCLYLDIGDDLWDASPRAADGEDFHEEHGRNEGPTSYPAQRWLARVRDEGSGEIVFGWHPLDGSGCADFELPGGDAELRIEWVRWAVWNDSPDTGNQMVGYRCDAALSTCDLQRQQRTVSADMATGTTVVVVEQNDVAEVDLVFWSATFAEERFASVGEQPLENTRMYVSYDPMNLLPGATQADRTFGNQPSVIIDGNASRSKFTVAHELGHQQTMVALEPSFGSSDLDYCYDPALYPAAAAGCTPNHAMDSHEWQAAAAIEGIAHWYAVSVWNDVDIVECPACQPGARYVMPSAPDQAVAYVVPRQSPLCTAMGQPPCPAGVGNEWDWLSAFRLFRLEAPSTPSFSTMFTMLSTAFASGGWSPNAATDAFWVAFDQAMAGHLGASYGAWQAAALEMELGR